MNLTADVALIPELAIDIQVKPLPLGKPGKRLQQGI